ncbi:hypothetical protein KUTeg_002252 [Tegillarca granosa]|uniref:Uncharacterized protein n=1 Tax=Tegillarca granosa TaxID=220873 RepID=A0ABQ9FWK4_TEGGR|nr:hypothetical protein KUTeg_002252 [Tegillarca granosa]
MKIKMGLWYNSPLRLGRTFYRSYILIYQCQHRKISHLRMDKLYAGTQEEQAPVDGVVKGKIPEWISGSLFRNGPAMYEVGGQKYLHLFDGLAAIQKFEIKNGKATYSRKFVKSEAYKKNMAANKIVVSEFGTRAYYTDPCKTFFQRFFAKFVPDEPTDNTSVSVWPLKDRLFASTETNVIHEIDPENLDTIDRTLFHIIDKSTGEKVNRSYTYQSDGFFVFHHANAYEQDEVEFPQVNYNKYNGKKYRYLYGIIIKGIFDTVVKVDMENKTYKVWTEEDCYASEPIFVANPDGQDEDDGLVFFVLLGKANNVCVHVWIFV